MNNSLTEIKGIKVGHATNLKARTGCTVILSEDGFQGSCEVRGGAPGTREIALLDPTARMDQVHAVLLTGGSAFGLNAAGGVMDYLEDKDVGFPTGVARVPIVPSAVIFDLAYGDASIRPDKDMGYKACQNAVSDFKTGNVGVGTGATVGKIKGMDNCMKSGIGTASNKSGDIIVGALVVCNAFGDIYNYETGEIIAGARGENGEFVNSKKMYIQSNNEESHNKSSNLNPGENTTLAVVVTNANISKAMSKKVAGMAHDGLARSIAPVHTMLDGDVVFTLNSDEVENVDISLLGTLAAETVAEAVVNCVDNSDS